MPMSEDTIRALRDSGDLRGAATALIEAYGPAVYGYLCAVIQDEPRAADAFGDVCLTIWEELGSCKAPSFRAWAFVVARHRAHRQLRNAGRDRRNAPLSASPELTALADRVRTTTAVWHRTETREEIAQLRAALDPDEQTLLILRVERALSWREIAHVMEEQSEAALRKRFERLKARLREAARAAKLVR